MSFFSFLLGLLVGLLLLWWQRSRSNAKMKEMLRGLKSPIAGFTSPTAQLRQAVAQQQQQQQHLEQQLEAYKQVLQTAPVGYLQVDDENRLIWCNAKVRELLGISHDSYVAKPRLLLELVRSFELDDLIEQTRDAGKPCQSSWTFYPVNADPSYLSEQQSYALRGYGLPLPENQVGVFLENCQETVNLVRQRDRWASDLAHELKTPLTSIRLIAETLQIRMEPAQRIWIDRLINETIRLSNLVQDLLDLSRIDRGTYVLQLQPTDLVDLIHSVWSSLEPLAEKKQLYLDYQGPNSLIAQVDEQRIYRLLVNLLDNSIKHSPFNKPIQVKLGTEVVGSEAGASPTKQVCLEVIDCGAGFPEKALPHVFERFFRADPSRSRLPSRPQEGLSPSDDRTHSSLLNTAHFPSDTTDGQPQGGSGLGLAIVRQIVEVHRGEIAAGNHPETKGAWLQVWLPLVASDSGSLKED